MAQGGINPENDHSFERLYDPSVSTNVMSNNNNSNDLSVLESGNTSGVGLVHELEAGGAGWDGIRKDVTVSVSYDRFR